MTHFDDEVITIARDLIRIDTTNYGPEGAVGERQAAEYVAASLDEVGISSQIVESEPGRANVVADFAPEGTDMSKPSLLIHCHTDVVPAQADDWTYPPFAGEIADGMLWGRGAVDMKHMVAMTLAVVRQRMRDNRTPSRPVRLIFFADEEAGSPLGAYWIADHHPEWFDGCTDAISEVGGFSLSVKDDLRLYLVQTAEKGMHWFKLIAEGVAGHGSMLAQDNAVVRLAQAVARIGTHRWPERLHPSQRAFIDTIEDAIGIQLHADTVEDTIDRLGGVARMVGATLSNTVNLTQLSAGYKANVIPGRAEAVLDGRFVPGLHDEMIDTVMELAGPGIRLETIMKNDSVEAEFAGQLADAMRQSIREFDDHGDVVPYLTSAGTDAKGFANRFGIRAFGFTPLQLPPELDFMALFHGVDERIPLESLRFGTKVLDRFLDLA